MFKPEAIPIGPRLSELRDRTNGQAKIFEGTGGIALVDSHRQGIVGTMPGADLIRGIAALWRALQANDAKQIYELSLPISSLIM
jgi:4-hydroxy-tetrahydrodipicolinate synthase